MQRNGFRPLKIPAKINYRLLLKMKVLLLHIVNNLRMASCLQLLTLVLFIQSCGGARKASSITKTSEPPYYSVDDFTSVEKFDSHVHLNTYDTPYIQQAVADNFRLLDIVDDRPFGIPMIEPPIQLQLMLLLMVA